MTLLAVCLLALLSGCNRNLRPISMRMPSWRPQSCVLPAEATMAEVVDHLNQRVEKTHAWSSTDVRVKSPQGLPMSIGGKIAVQSPRNFRLKLTAMGNDEADVGSNDEQLWMFMRRPQPQVITVRHDQIEEVQRQLPIPFEPDWLMQALGVAPIDPTDMVMERDPKHPQMARLVSQHTSPSGTSVNKVIVVDACKGVVTAHELYDSAQQLIARASLEDYRPQQGPDGAEILLPHEVTLDWPQAQMAMTMSIGHIALNPAPAQMPPQLWQMTPPPGIPVVQLPQQSPTRTASSAMERPSSLAQPVYTVPAEQPGPARFGQ